MPSHSVSCIRWCRRDTLLRIGDLAARRRDIFGRNEAIYDIPRQDAPRICPFLPDDLDAACRKFMPPEDETSNSSRPHHSDLMTNRAKNPRGVLNPHPRMPNKRLRPLLVRMNRRPRQVECGVITEVHRRHPPSLKDIPVKDRKGTDPIASSSKERIHGVAVSYRAPLFNLP